MFVAPAAPRRREHGACVRVSVCVDCEQQRHSVAAEDNTRGNHNTARVTMAMMLMGDMETASWYLNVSKKAVATLKKNASIVTRRSDGDAAAVDGGSPGGGGGGSGAFGLDVAAVAAARAADMVKAAEDAVASDWPPVTAHISALKGQDQHVAVMTDLSHTLRELVARIEAEFHGKVPHHTFSCV